MKRFLSTVKYVIIAMGMFGSAHAESHEWTGFYAGVDAGVVFNDVALDSQQLGFNSPSGTCDKSFDFSTFSSGIQLGYLHQFAHSFVAGIELNPTFNTNQKDTSSCRSEFNSEVYDSFTFKNQLQTSIKGRIARAVNWNENSFLPYLTIGASLAHLGLSYRNEGGDHYSDSTQAAGWLIGAGVEWSFMQNWSLRAEYNFVDYGNAITLDIPTVYGLFDNHGEGQVDLKTNNVFVGVSYWF